MKDSLEAHARRRQAEAFATSTLVGDRHLDSLKDHWKRYQEQGGRIKTFIRFQERFQELRDEYYEKHPLNEGIIIETGPRHRIHRQSAIEKANTTAELIAAIAARLSREKNPTKGPSKPKKDQPTWYLTLEGYDEDGNAALKTGFTGYENSTRPEAGKTYNPRVVEVLISRPNICAKDTEVWEDVLRNQLRQALENTHELDHEVFYGEPKNTHKAVAAFKQAADNTERLYRRYYSK